MGYRDGSLGFTHFHGTLSVGFRPDPKLRTLRSIEVFKSVCDRKGFRTTRMCSSEG